MYLINLVRALAADSLISLGYAIAPSYYLEAMFVHHKPEE